MLPERVAELRTRMTRAALSICRKYGHWERACHRSASSPAPRRPITLCDDQSVGETIVLLANDLQQEELERAGWHVSARSFGAQLDVDRIDSEGLARLVTRAGPAIRELRADDVDAILTLDAATSGDYPGGVATRHDPLTPHSAAASDSRRAFGAFLADGELVAMTFVDVHGRQRRPTSRSFTPTGAGGALQPRSKPPRSLRSARKRSPGSAPADRRTTLRSCGPTPRSATSATRSGSPSLAAQREARSARRINVT